MRLNKIKENRKQHFLYDYINRGFKKPLSEIESTRNRNETKQTKNKLILVKIKIQYITALHSVSYHKSQFASEIRIIALQSLFRSFKSSLYS